MAVTPLTWYLEYA